MILLINRHEGHEYFQNHINRMNSSSILESQAHSDEIAKCLVDLHGTCFILPFRSQGLPYLALLLVAVVQVTLQFQRIIAREIHSPNPPNEYLEWQLLFGRFGLVCFTLATALDHFRLLCGAIDASWPDYILTAPNAQIANQLWRKYGYGGTTVQTFLWWYCCFLQAVMLPVTLFAVSYIYAKARMRLRLRLPLMVRHYFILNCAFVSLFLILGLLAFVLGPVRMPLKLVKVTGLWSLTTTSRLMMTDLIVATVYVWQGSLVVLAAVLWRLEGPSKRISNTLFLLVVVTSLVVNCCVSSQSTNTTTTTTGSSAADSSWWSAVAKLLTQMAIGAQMWADVTHNPDDYGRLNDDMYQLLPSRSLREPLLTANAHLSTHTTTATTVETEQENDGESVLSVQRPESDGPGGEPHHEERVGDQASQ